jgi:tight adherence protein B
MSPLLISTCVFVAVVALVGGVMVFVRDMSPTRAEDRLQILTGQKAAEIESKGLMKDELFQEGVSGLAGMFNGVVQYFENLCRLFEQSESALSPSAFFGLSFVLALLGAAGAAIARAPVPLYPVAGVAAGTVPLFVLLFRRRTRFKKFARHLPDALELIARALRSGHSLASGLKVVSEEIPAPIATEFNSVYETQNLGVGLDQALRDMLKRMPNMDLSSSSPR